MASTVKELPVKSECGAAVGVLVLG